MRAGVLRHRVTFQSLVVEQDSDGATVEGWVDTFDRPQPAEISPLSGKEFISAQATQSEVSGRMRVRYRPEYRASMRAVHRGQVYKIIAVLPDADSGRDYLTLLTATGVSEGQ